MTLYLRDRGIIAGPPIALTYREFVSTNNPGAQTNATAQLADLGPSTENRTLIVLGRTGTNGAVSAVYYCGQQLVVHYTPSDAASIKFFIASGFIPKNTSGPLVICTPGLFNAAFVYAYSVTGLASIVPVSTAISSTALDTTRSVDLNTSPGGVVVGMAYNNITAGQSCTWSGDQTPTKNAENNSGGIWSSASITGANQDAANTLTATYAVISTTSCSLIGAAFR